ncbi:DUF4376 domain-containing protein [Mesorhizobium sp. A556]
MTLYTHPNLPDFTSPAPFKLGEGDETISYARGWWQKTTPQKIASLGFVEYVAPGPETPTLEQLREAKIAAVNAKVSAVLSGGFTVPTGAMAGEVLQTRDNADRINWLVSQASYSAAVAGGQGAVEDAKFRTADNDTFTMSYADGLNVLLAMAAWGAACMDNSWSIKDAVNAADDQAALDAIDIDTGWPA